MKLKILEIINSSNSLLKQNIFLFFLQIFLFPISSSSSLQNYEISTFEPTKQSGTTATVTCQVGYSISGSGTTTCSNGAWNPPLGTCNLGGTGTGTGGANCIAQIAPAGANLVYSQGGQFGPFPSGTQVTVQCTNGGTVQGEKS